MDFVGLIKTSRLPNAVLYRPFVPPCEISVHITGHHLILRPKVKKEKEIKILHRAIDSVERRTHEQARNHLTTLTLRTKHLLTIRLDISSSSLEDVQNAIDTLEKLSALEDVSRSFAFSYTPDFVILEDGWNMFQLEYEHYKLIHASDTEWRISYVNKDFSVCKTYPPTVIVPSSISDENLKNSAQFRQGGRFPVLSYRHINGNVIVRTSQPLTGPNHRRCRDDERIFAALIGRQKRGFIIDTRTPTAAQSERAKGGGFETEQNYPRWKRINKSIDRYYYLLDSYSKLMEACSDLNATSEKWISRLIVSSWLTHVKEILNCGCLIAQVLEKENSSVVVHGSEGLDITAIVSCLAQIILNPDCRTFRGFEALIELEWIQAGHPFWTRTSKGPLSDSVASKSKNYSPTFVIFLDCVYQIYRQFPCSFEFTEDLLVFLADEAYAGNFGTFLCDSEAEKMALKVKESTISIWSYLNRPEVLERYINCVYDPNKAVIWPSVAPISLALWSSMYLRWIVDLSPKLKVQQKAKEIMEQNKKAKAEVIKLRKQILDTIKEAESFGLISTEEDRVSMNMSGQHSENNLEATTESEEDRDSSSVFEHLSTE